MTGRGMFIAMGLAANVLATATGAPAADRGGLPAIIALRGELIEGGLEIRGVLLVAAAGGGTIHAARSDGVSCTGSFRYLDAGGTSGSGRLSCGGGRNGDFWFARDGANLLACGILDGRAAFRFVAGEMAFAAGYPLGFDCGVSRSLGKKGG